MVYAGGVSVMDESWIIRNGRYLDVCRWRALTMEGNKQEVLYALRAFQNEDGGFGYGLEPDCWNPESSPIQTWAAIRILDEIGIEDSGEPIIQDILRYLDSGASFTNDRWMATIPSNDKYPHAPWWSFSEEWYEEWGFNPTASLIGFILRFAESSSSIYAKAEQIAAQAMDYFYQKDSMDSHELQCFIDLYEWCRKGGYEGIHLGAFKKSLRRRVKEVISKDETKWYTEYVPKPSDFIHSKESIFYTDHIELIEKEIHQMQQHRNQEGIWDITWTWSPQYPKEYQLTTQWWKSEIFLKNMLFLRNME